MQQFVVGAILATCAFAAPQKLSGVPTLDGRIVGGEDVNIEEFPYQVSLLLHGSHICGGSIISSKYVVTAAHCTAGSSASQLRVRAGSSIRNSGGVVVSVRRIHQNPSYDYFEIDYDISVLELSSELTFGPRIGPVALQSDGEEVQAGTSAYCTGWGALREGGTWSSQLQGVEVPIVDHVSCVRTYAPTSVTDRMICAGVTEGAKDACLGDSGGPLVANGKLVGIVSWGYGCARPRYPGVYSNVASLRSYIDSISGI